MSWEESRQLDSSSCFPRRYNIISPVQALRWGVGAPAQTSAPRARAPAHLMAPPSLALHQKGRLTGRRRGLPLPAQHPGMDPLLPVSRMRPVHLTLSSGPLSLPSQVRGPQPVRAAPRPAPLQPPHGASAPARLQPGVDQKQARPG